MKTSPVYFVAGLTFLVICLAALSRSPAWAQLRFNDYLALFGVALSAGVMGMWVGVRSLPKKTTAG